MVNWPEAVFTPASTRQLQEFTGVQIGPESELLLEEDELLLLEEETPDKLDDELLLEELDDEELLEDGKRTPIP